MKLSHRFPQPFRVQADNCCCVAVRIVVPTKAIFPSSVIASHFRGLVKCGGEAFTCGARILKGRWPDADNGVATSELALR